MQMGFGTVSSLGLGDGLTGVGIANPSAAGYAGASSVGGAAGAGAGAAGQAPPGARAGLTLVHFSAQPEPLLH